MIIKEYFIKAPKDRGGAIMVCSTPNLLPGESLSSYEEFRSARDELVRKNVDDHRATGTR